MYKKGLTKAEYKEKMRDFWQVHWLYQTVEEWIDLLYILRDEADGSSMLWYRYNTKHDQKKAERLMLKALDKYVLEKLINKTQAKNLWQMINASKDDAVIAFAVLTELKPNKFKAQEKNEDNQGIIYGEYQQV